MSEYIEGKDLLKRGLYLYSYGEVIVYAAVKLYSGVTALGQPTIM